MEIICLDLDLTVLLESYQTLVSLSGDFYTFARSGSEADLTSYRLLKSVEITRTPPNRADFHKTLILTNDFE